MLFIFFLFAYNKQENSQLFPVMAVLSQNELGVKLQSTEILQKGQLTVGEILSEMKIYMLYIESIFLMWPFYYFTLLWTETTCKMTKHCFPKLDTKNCLVFKYAKYLEFL